VKAYRITQVWGNGAVGRGCADRAVAGSGQALPAGFADHRSGSGPSGLDPRVYDPSGAPAGIPSNGSDGEGCWGEETAGANAVVGVDVGRVIAVPVGDPPSDVTVLRQWGPAQKL
jgi:hypothetical protein